MRLRWTELFARDVRQSGVHVASMIFSWWAERLHYFFKNIIHDRILQDMCDVFRRTPMMMRTFFSLCFHFREDMRIFTHFIPFLYDSSLLSRVLLANNACVWRLLRYGPQKKIYSWLFRIYIAIKKNILYIAVDFWSRSGVLLLRVCDSQSIFWRPALYLNLLDLICFIHISKLCIEDRRTTCRPDVILPSSIAKRGRVPMLPLF